MRNEVVRHVCVKVLKNYLVRSGPFEPFALGLKLGRRLRGGTSRVPGVEHLAALINDGNPVPRPLKRRAVPAEIAPAAAPTGRGDEAASAPTAQP